MNPVRAAELFTAAELAEWGTFAQEKYWGYAAYALSSLVFFSILLFTPANAWLRDRAERLVAPLSVPDGADGARARVAAAFRRIWGDRTWAAAIAYVLLYFVVTQLWDLPYLVWAGYLRPHRYGLSNLTPSTFALHVSRDALVSVLAFGAMAFGLFGLKRRLPRWWLVLGLPTALALAFSGLLDPYRARLHHEQVPLEEGPLRARLEALCARAGHPIAGIEIEDASKVHKVAGAYFAGLGPTRKVVLLDNLVARYTEDEIEAAVAHELGHVADREGGGDLRTWLAALVVVPLLWLVERLLRAAAARPIFRLRSASDPAAVPLLLAAFWVVTSVVEPVQLAMSRRAEREADRYALALTDRPDALASVFVKLSRDAKTDVDPAPVWRWLYHSHPPALERIELCRAHAASRGLPDPVAGLRL